MNNSDNGASHGRQSVLSVDQMQARCAALEEAAMYLRCNADRLPEAIAMADELHKEAEKWNSRALRAQNLLTDAQRRTYDHLLDFFQDHGRSPTIVQLGKMDNISSHAARNRVLALIRKGFITKRPNAMAGLAICMERRGR
jgi:hypothetical protein